MSFGQVSNSIEILHIGDWHVVVTTVKCDKGKIPTYYLAVFFCKFLSSSSHRKTNYGLIRMCSNCQLIAVICILGLGIKSNCLPDNTYFVRLILLRELFCYVYTTYASQSKL